MNKKIIVLILTILFISVFLFFPSKFSEETKVIKAENDEKDNLSYSSSFIENVMYESQDTKGNKYIIRASLGEIDYQNPNEIFLTDVLGIINLVDKSNIMIKSDFGKYNIGNNDTIFSKNVKIENYQNQCPRHPKFRQGLNWPKQNKKKLPAPLAPFQAIFPFGT